MASPTLDSSSGCAWSGRRRRGQALRTNGLGARARAPSHGSATGAVSGDGDPGAGAGLGVVVPHRVVLHAAVVPEGDRVLAPAEAALEVRVRDVLEQEVEEGAALALGDPEDPPGEGPVDVEGGPPGRRGGSGPPGAPRSATRCAASPSRRRRAPGRSPRRRGAPTRGGLRAARGAPSSAPRRPPTPRTCTRRGCRRPTPAPCAGAAPSPSAAPRRRTRRCASPRRSAGWSWRRCG